MECTLTLQCVELALHALAGRINRICDSLEIALLIDPVVEELIAQAELFEVRLNAPCATHWLVQDALAAVVQRGLTLALHGVWLGNRRLFLEQCALNLAFSKSWIGRTKHEAVLFCVRCDLVHTDV